jgi:DNA-binding MltR family transcriptional regulator
MKNSTVFSKEVIADRRHKMSEILRDETERGCVLVSVAFIDESLELLLRGHFKLGQPVEKTAMSSQTREKNVINPLFAASGPLSSFWSKTQLCFALNLIPEWVHHDLEVIRKIRNVFAHSYEQVSFESQEVATPTKTLVAPVLMAEPSNDGEMNLDISAYDEAKAKEMRYSSKEHLCFALSASYISGYLSALLIVKGLMVENDTKEEAPAKQVKGTESEEQRPKE